MAEPVTYPGGVNNKPPFEMGVANFERKLFVIGFDKTREIVNEYVIKKNGISRINKWYYTYKPNIPLLGIVYQEIISESFIGKDDSVFPEWVPSLDDKAGIEKIMDRICQKWEGGM